MGARSPWTLGLLALWAAATLVPGRAAATATQAAGQQAAARPGDAETCGVCHEDLVKSFAGQPHAALRGRTCTACHGTAEKHLEQEGGGGVFAFRAADLPAAKSSRCLACHQKDNPRFPASPHARSGLDCTSCHAVHAETSYPKMLRYAADAVCSSCHDDIYARFQQNERHRLLEGVMSCASCHNPHEPSTRARLGGFKQQACLECHRDKGGPFLYEHQASLIEGCTVCHEVHGSPNRHMLVQESVADLCFSCHADAPAWHAGFTSAGTNCVTCHSAIHGSNLSRRFLK